MKNTFLLGMLALMLQSSTCFQKKDCENNMKFKLDFALTPKDTFKIGDTLWVQARISDTMMDRNTNRFIATNNLELATEIILSKIDTNVVTFAMTHFKIIIDTGSLKYRPPGALKILWDTTGTMQILKVGLIPLKRGLYSFAPNFFFEEANNSLKISKNDCFDILNMEYQTNQGNCNYHLLKRSQQDSLSEQQYKEHGIYGFEVIR